MVQVDVFWSYGIGAGVAFAHTRSLLGPRRPAAPVEIRAPLTDVVLFLACAFVPSGTYLVTAFPHWETMHAARTLADLPPWLVTGFTLTNATQGVLGWWIGERLVRSGRAYLAYLQWLAAYLAMFFVLVHGWDGTGYQRFFSARPEQLADWSWATAGAWLGSDVATTLYAMGVVVIPWILWMMARPLSAGLGGARTAGSLALEVLGVNTIGVLSVAVAASAFVRFAGWSGGAALTALLLAILAHPRMRLLHRHFRSLVGEPEAVPVPIGSPVA